MKNTRYFSTIEEAQQYYGGNVVPSTEIALVGAGSYVFVSSDNAQSGNQQYFDASMTNDEIVTTMTYTAYNEGFTYGETVTYPVAYAAGEAYGYTQGYEGGYSYGYDEGYTEGEAQGGGTSLTDSQIDSIATGNFINNVFSLVVYTAGYNEMTDYDTPTVDAEAFKLALYTISVNGNESDIMYVQEYDGSSCVHKTTGFTVLDAGEDNDYDQGSLAWSGTVASGHKIGLNLFILATDLETGEFDTDSSTIYFFKQRDSQTNNYTYNMIDVNATSDVTFKFGLSTDAESGDSVLEFTYSIVPQ